MRINGLSGAAHRGTVDAAPTPSQQREWTMLRGLWTDLRYSVRALARSPGATALAVAAIALGVGVNAGIFTTVNGLLFRDLPAGDAHELVMIQQSIDTGAPNPAGRTSGFSTAQYRSLSAQTTTLSGISGNSDPTRTTLGGASPQHIVGTIVTCEYFDVLRQPPALGRALRAADCATGAEPVVVLAHELWTTAFESDPNVVGRVIELNRQLFTVVGVAQEGTYGGLGLYRTEYFAPISAQPLLLPSEDSYGNDDALWLSVVGRRTAGIEQVRAELAVFAAQLDSAQPKRRTTMLVERATPLGNLPGILRTGLQGVAAAVMVPFALVLLIASANVANLLLARASARNREIGIRFSLGASRARVMRQLLAESMLIAVAGGVLGSVLAVWAFQALTAVVIPRLTMVGLPPFFIDATPDFRVVAVMAGVMVATGVLFGLAPALQASKPDLNAVIKQDSAGTVIRSGSRLQATLVGAQVAVCMMLMVGVGLLLRGLTSTQTIDPGFDARNVAVASYDLRNGYDAAGADAFQRRLLEEARTLPGVEAAAQVVTEPLNPDTENSVIRLPSQDGTQARRTVLNWVTPGYFDLVGIPIARGRAFDAADTASGSMAAIVTETTARNLWPDRDPIGQTLLLAIGFDQDAALEIVGVARDAQVAVVGQVEPYYVYLPPSQRVAPLLQLLVRSRADFASTAAIIRAGAKRLDPGLAVRVRPLEANIDYWRNLSGTLTGLTASLGLLALVLGAVGIYGVVSYFVGRREREIAIRVALGARPAGVLALILRRTMRPVVVGAFVGLAGAVALSGVLSSVLFGVSPLDPIGIGAAALFVLAVALAAGFLPGRSALRQQPSTALHHE
jgi:predicted permease